MCGPAALALAAVGTQVVGTVIGGFTARAQANYEAKVAQANAANERENIRLEQERGNREALLHYRRVAQLKGQQRVAAAANGATTDSSTAQDIVNDTNLLAREDANNIYGQTYQNVRGMDRNVSNYVAQARAAKSRGKGALIGSFFDAAGTALGGASQYKNLRNQGYK